MVFLMWMEHNWHWRCKSTHAQSGIDVAHCNCKARICKREQGRHLYELEMVSAECRAPSCFRNACLLHRQIMFIIIVIKCKKLNKNHTSACCYCTKRFEKLRKVQLTHVKVSYPWLYDVIDYETTSFDAHDSYYKALFHLNVKLI